MCRRVAGDEILTGRDKMSTSSSVKLGKYQIVKLLDRGTMGIVYLAHDPDRDREVVLKVSISKVLRNKSSGERYWEMFFNEAKAARQLQHPNIVNIYDAGAEGDKGYIVMEYVKGGKTLQPFCKPENLLPIEKVAEISFKCARALDYAHSHGVIHRDIKATNILLSEDMDVRIADFSIAHLAGGDGDNSKPTGFMGSPAYMSPEQARQDVITSQTDLFSLGVVMYEMLTGKKPFAGKSLSELFSNIINLDPPPVRECRPEVPEGLERIVQRALRKDTTQRYLTGLELADDLRLSFPQLGSTEGNFAAMDNFDAIKDLDFFQGFSDSQIKEIIRAGTLQESGAGEQIVSEGDYDDSFFIIVSGRATVMKGGKSVGTLAAGESFGEMGYFAKTRRSAGIVADTDMSLIKVAAILIEQASADCHHRLHEVFLKTVIERLSRMTGRVAEL